MLLLELLEDVRLLLLVRTGQTLLLLLLIEHHLLNHAAGLPVKVGQLGVVRLDLGNVDLGSRSDDVSPPFHLVDLVEVDLDSLGTIRVGAQSPGGVINVDRVRKIALS